MDIAYEAPNPAGISVAILIEQIKRVLVLRQRFNIVDALWSDNERFAFLLIGFCPVKAVVVDKRPFRELFRSYGIRFLQTLGK